ncbi:MAG: divalent metal cation transporter [Nitrososphaerota archaeon]|jgi:Mn2+/Fe2+ NRAMP family transporter|nr:divalent metal cation transporter [Nitrososphaerota archaeon]
MRISGGSLLGFLKVIGPAWIVMIADVDAASVVTAGESGALFGYRMIFVLLMLILPLFIIQEAAGRLGVVTGGGLASNIRSTYSKRIAVLASIPMFLTDFLSYVVEYVGIAVGFEILGISPVISLPVVYVLHTLLVFTGSYRRTERILLVVTALLLFSYVLDAFLVKPDVHLLISTGLTPFQPYLSPNFAYLLAANVGAVVMPWMLFYQAGAVAQKELKQNQLTHERLETFLGAIASEGLMVSIVIVSAQMKAVNILSPASLLNALVPLAGSYAFLVFGLGLVSASFLALVVISLASTWGVAESMGWRAKIGDRFRVARNFYIVYIFETLPAVIFPFLFTNLVSVMLNLMVVYVFVLVAPGILTGLLCSNGHLMGKHVMSVSWRLIYWSMLTLVVLAGLLALPSLI